MLRLGRRRNRRAKREQRGAAADDVMRQQRRAMSREASIRKIWNDRTCGMKRQAQTARCCRGKRRQSATPFRPPPRQRETRLPHTNRREN